MSVPVLDLFAESLMPIRTDIKLSASTCTSTRQGSRFSGPNGAGHHPRAAPERYPGRGCGQRLGLRAAGAVRRPAGDLATGRWSSGPRRPVVRRPPCVTMSPSARQNLGLAPDVIDARVESALRAMGMLDFVARPPHLSG